MNTVRRNTLFNTISSTSRFLSNALLFIILAKALGVAEFGRFALALSFTGIFLVLIDYGFNLQVVRDVSKSPGSVARIMNRVVTGKMLLILPASGVLIVTVKLLRYPMETQLLIYILWLAALFYSFGFFFNTIFRGLNQFQYETYPTVIVNMLQTGILIAMILLHLHSLAIAIGYLTSRVVYSIDSFRLVRKRIGPPRFTFDLSTGWKVLRESFSFGTHAVLAALYLQLDTVFLSYYRGNAEVGYYQAAVRVAMATMVIWDILVSAYFPVISRSFEVSAPNFRSLSTAFNRRMWLIGSSMAAFLLFFPGFTIKLLYGDAYLKSVPILQLLSLTVFLRFVMGGYASLITIAGKQSWRALGVGISLAVNVLANLALVPRYGSLGAAAASILTHAVLGAIYMFSAVHFLKSTFLVPNPFRRTVAVQS